MDRSLSFTFDKAEIDFFHHITPQTLADRSAKLDGRSNAWSKYLYGQPPVW